MNRSKTTMNVESAPQKKKKTEGGHNKRAGIIAACIGAVLFIGLIALVAYDYLYVAPCIYVDGESYNINDIEVRYNVYNAEGQVEMDALAGAYTGNYEQPEDYWYVDGVKENAETVAKSASVRNLVMYKEAVDKGITLTKEEKEKIKKEAKAFFDGMEDGHKKRVKFSQDEYIEYVEKVRIANKYIDQIKEGYNVTNDSLDKPVKKEDFDEVKFQVIVVGTTTGTSDSDKGTKLDDALLKEYKEKMEGYLAKAKTGTDLEKLVEEKDQSTYQYMETTLIRGTKTYQTLLDALEKLNNGQLCDTVIDDGKAYYVVKMVEKNCTDAYEDAVEDAVSARQEELFNDELNKLMAKHDVKTGSGWDDVEMGTVVIYPGDSVNEFYAVNEIEDDDADAENTASPDASASPEATK